MHVAITGYLEHETSARFTKILKARFLFMIFKLILYLLHTGFSKITSSFFKSGPSNLDTVFYCKGCIFLNEFGFPTLVQSFYRPSKYYLSRRS